MLPDAVEPLLTPGEVAARFKVDPKTVTRWARQGKLTAIRTLGAHRRYREAEVKALLDGAPVPPVSLVERDGRVTAVRNGQEIGYARPGGVADVWFAQRVDRRSGRVVPFASRELAIKFLEGGETGASR